jgi:hypothetical protein
LLYDRGSESLWMVAQEGLRAVAGRNKGALLPRVTKVELVAWSDWIGKYPQSRLLVGADRQAARPKR